MAPLALLLAACALAAPLHAASIPDNSQRKIPVALPEDDKELAPAKPAHDLAGFLEPVKQIENELRIKPEDIPVEVVLDNVDSSVKLIEVDEEVKRPAVDLRNPGPPQRQEHETQNPEQHSDEQLKISTIKETIERTQVLLKQSVQDTSENIQNWISSNGTEINVQKFIADLRETFTNQIHKLNDTIQSLVRPEASQPQEEESLKKYGTVESRLKILKDNFDDGVETLSVGVELVASLKSAEESESAKEETSAVDPAKPAEPAVPVKPAEPAKPAEPTTQAPAQNFLQQWMQNWSNTLASNVNAIQNAFRPPQPAATVQADTPVASTTTARPPWNNPLLDIYNNYFPPLNFTLTNPFQNFRPQSSSPNATQTGPLSGFQNSIQNLISQNPLANISNNIANYFRPGSTPEKPAEASSNVSEGPTAAAQPKPDAEKPAVAQASPPAPESAASQPAPAASEPQPGPIRQFLNNIPVVQRIQNSIANRDTPRQPTEKNESASQTKGGFIVGHKPGGSGDNNNVDSGLTLNKHETEMEVMEPIKEEQKKETEVELKPETVVEKTE